VPRAWVVEDNDASFELVEFLLVEGGWDVARARDAGQLRNLLESAAADVVLLDMHLPDASGLELLAELRADRRHRDVPVLALTAHAMRGDRERFLAAGCDGYLSKPIDTSTFLEQVRRQIERKRG
jgi:two-component system cell cycle response regulator DivK